MIADFFFSSRRRHTRFDCDWSSDVCSSDLVPVHGTRAEMSGAVVRPFIYELKPGETLGDLIKAAGGFRPNADLRRVAVHRLLPAVERDTPQDRKSTRLNSSHSQISYAVFCLKKKKVN